MPFASHNVYPISSLEISVDDLLGDKDCVFTGHTLSVCGLFRMWQISLHKLGCQSIERQRLQNLR